MISYASTIGITCKVNKLKEYEMKFSVNVAISYITGLGAFILFEIGCWPQNTSWHFPS